MMTAEASAALDALDAHLEANPNDRAAYQQRADLSEELGLPDARYWRLYVWLRQCLSAAVIMRNLYGDGCLPLPQTVPLPHYLSEHERAAGYARQYNQWLTDHADEVQAAVATARREREWTSRARQGDALAALAVPVTRTGITALAAGQKTSIRSSDWASRKAIAGAKAIMVARLQRRADRQVGEMARNVPTGRVRARWLKKLKKLAVLMGEQYHRTTARLYASKYGGVLYGRGGQEISDDSRYSKSWHRSYGNATCRCGGARLDSEGDPRWVILENYRGTEVARLPLPRSAS